MVEKLKKPERLKRENPDLIWENLLLNKPASVLDIGCGIGFASIPFAKKIPKGIVYACDISEEMLDMLKPEIEQAGVTNIKPVLMEEVKVPLDDEIADCILMQNLYHEFKDARENLRECRRLLKLGGKLGIVDWKKEEMAFGPPLDIRVEAKKIEKDLMDAGFLFITNIDVLPYHNFFVAVNP